MSQVNFINQTILKHTNHQFQYLRELGKGAFGRVFLIASSNGLKLAVKAISLQQAQKNRKGQVMKQVQILSQLKHKNIVRYKGHILVKDKSLFIFSQYCNQGSLDARINSLDPGSIKQLLVGITEGLAFLHSKEITHQDIKLENIFLNEDVPKIADFGLASKVQDSGPTSLSQFRGTPYYMAPQLLLGRRFQPAADIWALGLVFLELIVGQRIYTQLKGPQILCRRPDFPEVLLKKVKKIDMQMLIRLMLQRDPLKRPKAVQVLAYLSNPNTLSAQIPDFSSHIKLHCSFQDKRVIRYDARVGPWYKSISCEQCGGEATLKRQCPVDEDAQSVKSSASFTNHQLYRAGYGAVWECSQCQTHGFWLREYQ